MSCRAVTKREVERRGKPSIEFYDNNGKPVYYCYGWIDCVTGDLKETCSLCRQNVIYAQEDLDKINKN